MKHLLKLKSIVYFICLLSWTSLFAQLTINVTSVPENTPVNDNIHLAGNLNGWDPGNSDYILTNNGDGTYQITITPEIGTLEYKFTRGSWTAVEGDAQAQEIGNRTFSYSGGQQTENVTILSWKDLGAGNGSGTAAENVSILDLNFNIPQLNRTRRIWVYLPPDYDTSTNTYPVLYMQDGQNLFDANTSFSGEWEVDESLNDLFANGDEGIIVIGIDNGGGSRIDEYSPWVNPQYGGGEGDEYVNFIVETLKPHIDTNFRTKSDRENTGIMGSSLGGLISFYAAIEHQDVFSKAGIFSPSFWFSDDVYTHVTNTGKTHDMKIYLLGGEQESASLIPDMNTMVTTLQNAGFAASEIEMITHVDGEHSEWYWQREFPAAYTWLFNNDNLSVSTIDNKTGVKIVPNPFSEAITIVSPELLNDAKLEIYSVDGKLVYSNLIPFSGELYISNLEEGFYVLKIVENNRTLFIQKALHKVD